MSGAGRMLECFSPSLSSRDPNTNAPVHQARGPLAARARLPVVLVHDAPEGFAGARGVRHRFGPEERENHRQLHREHTNVNTQVLPPARQPRIPAPPIMHPSRKNTEAVTRPPPTARHHPTLSLTWHCLAPHLLPNHPQPTPHHPRPAERTTSSGRSSTLMDNSLAEGGQ